MILLVDSRGVKVTETESRMVVARSREERKMGSCFQWVFLIPHPPHVTFVGHVCPGKANTILIKKKNKRKTKVEFGMCQEGRHPVKQTLTDLAFLI